MSYYKENHVLPTVRVTKVILENFKSVKYGEVDFQCGREFVPYGTRSDILGIYGQNGSGKTALIEALAILKNLAMGLDIDDDYADCLPDPNENSRLEFTFDFQYPDQKIRKVVYAFSLRKAKLPEKRLQDYRRRMGDEFSEKLPFVYCVNVFDETLSVSGDINGKQQKLQSVIDTSYGKPFGPASKLCDWVEDVESHLIDFEVNKRLAVEKSQSFIFMEETVKIFKEFGKYHPYYQVLLELHLFCREYLFVLSTKSSGLIRLNVVIPIHVGAFTLEINSYGATKVPEKSFEDIIEAITGISDVLVQLVPGLSIAVKNLSESTFTDGEKARLIELYSVRNGKELPLRYESDGVRKIISELFLIMRVYGDKSATVAIDEFDAGIFEYLLGEILQIIEKSGRGQFIFTSHNLRPLEVINRKFICFTTTNPKNRYVRLKNISSTSNLRTTYFREIVLGGQNEELYAETQQYKIIEALDKAADHFNAPDEPTSVAEIVEEVE